MPERAAAALQWQAARVLPVVCGPADGPAGGPSGRVCHPLGADTPMGRLGAHPLAVLDGGVPGPHGAGPYNHPYHDWTVLCEPGGHTQCSTRQSPTGVDHVYPTFWQCPPADDVFIIPLLIK